jgi:hypothetical protein
VVRRWGNMHCPTPGDAGAALDITIDKADITAVSGITASNKTYDGGVTATLNTGAASFAGKLGGDTLTVATSSGAFVNKMAANGKTVNITGITLGGADAGNYNLLDATSTATANITKASLTVDVQDASVAQGSSYTPNFTYAGFGTGDNATNVGITPGVTPAASTAAAGVFVLTATGPASLANYDVTYQTGQLTVTAAPSTGTTQSGASGAASSVQAGQARQMADMNARRTLTTSGTADPTALGYVTCVSGGMRLPVGVQTDASVSCQRF